MNELCAPTDLREQIASSDDPTGYDIRWKMAEVLEQGFTDQAVAALRKKVSEITNDIETDLDYRLKENMSANLAGWITDMAECAVSELLKGNDERMRSYLSAREGYYTGRDRDHQVIHGRLFETGAIELRKQIVDAHAELLKSERVLDLEDQVRSLVSQVNKLEARNRELVDRLNCAIRD